MLLDKSKIYDCITFYDENLLVNTRFEILDDERLTVSANHFSIYRHHFTNGYELNGLSFSVTTISML